MPSARDPEVIYRAFGRRLQKLRENKKLSQEELAVWSGLSRSSIANIERGRQRVLLHQIVLFAETLETDVNALVPTLTEINKDHQTVRDDAKSLYLSQLLSHLPTEKKKRRL